MRVRSWVWLPPVVCCIGTTPGCLQKGPSKKKSRAGRVALEAMFLVGTALVEAALEDSVPKVVLLAGNEVVEEALPGSQFLTCCRKCFAQRPLGATASSFSSNVRDPL